MSTKRARPKLHSLPIDCAGTHLPISVLIDPADTMGPATLPKNSLLFCYRVLINTIDSLLDRKYTHFDAITTSHCCHGVTALAWHLIQDALELDLPSLKQELTATLDALTTAPDGEFLQPPSLPKHLLNLAALYILYYVRENDPEKGCRTKMRKLRDLAPMTSKMYSSICQQLQKQISNWSAESYADYFRTMDASLQVSGAPITAWGKYVQGPHIRVDQRGFKYTATLFSMQVLLGYLSHSGAKVAIVNDIYPSSSLELLDRYICVLQGDGNGGFIPLNQTDLFERKDYDLEPVFVLGGCSHHEQPDKSATLIAMEPWTQKLTNLVLATDVFYPQFFVNKKDANFNIDPIVPDEALLQELIQSHANYGTSLAQPSLYYLSHIFSASMQQLKKLVNRDDMRALPSFVIPGTWLN